MQKFQQPEAEAAFIASLDHVLARWSLVRLAIDMGWGDGDPKHNVSKLRDETLTWFQKRRATVEASDLEDILTDFISDNFHVIAEDGSPKEVSLLLVELYKQCKTGDLTLANQIIAQPVSEEPIAGACQSAPEPEEFDGDEAMSDSDDEMSGSGGGGGAGGGGGGARDGSRILSMIETTTPPSPQVGQSSTDTMATASEPDGWETVTRSGRRFR